MKFRKLALGALAVLAVAGAAGWFSLDKETRGLLATFPTNRDLLFWSEAQRDAAFRPGVIRHQGENECPSNDSGYGKKSLHGVYRTIRSSAEFPVNRC